jgi:hypothetical protein
MGEMRNACKTFVGKPEGCRQFWKTRGNCYNIKMDLNTILILWTGFVAMSSGPGTVMNLRFEGRGRSFLTR